MSPSEVEHTQYTVCLLHGRDPPQLSLPLILPDISRHLRNSNSCYFAHFHFSTLSLCMSSWLYRSIILRELVVSMENKLSLLATFLDVVCFGIFNSPPHLFVLINRFAINWHRKFMQWNFLVNLKWSKDQIQPFSGKKEISWPLPTVHGLFR